MIDWILPVGYRSPYELMIRVMLPRTSDAARKATVKEHTLCCCRFALYVVLIRLLMTNLSMAYSIDMSYNTNVPGPGKRCLITPYSC
jgi:hypothetical protein